MGEIDFDDKQYQAAVARGNAERLDRPIPVSVRYEAKPGRIVVEFESGASFMVPTSALQGLAKADPHDLAQVELLGETGLHWPSLDIDFTIASLMQGVFGTASFMEAQRKGGQSRSPEKTAAARRNGLRGGRPRKSS
ncbi:DUF2442 domain-containing protein [Devosia honganensis]|uniref:DUF2442 domain-containing protein n=1 Tax=Devosia honganensis TaxID=1610527 RepID=A0ABV7X0F6_9HYPH